MMKSYTYYSSATKSFDEKQLEQLLNTSANNNKALGVTGMLIYADMCFFQVFEGPNEIVDALYKKIEQDPRHKGIITILEENILSRRFPDWSMGGFQLDPNIKEHEAAFELTRQAIDNKLHTSAPEILKILMNSFYNSSTRYVV